MSSENNHLNSNNNNLDLSKEIQDIELEIDIIKDMVHELEERDLIINNPELIQQNRLSNNLNHLDNLNNLNYLTHTSHNHVYHANPDNSFNLNSDSDFDENTQVNVIHAMDTLPTHRPNIYLASGSPRRLEILQNLGYIVQKLAIEIDETPQPNEIAEDYVLRMAVEKNRIAVELFGSDELPLLSADTTVALNGEILGKPTSPDHAVAMLKALSGKTHQVLTAVCVAYQGREYSIINYNDVTFKSLNEREIWDYVASGEPMDKAGSYGIQGLGGMFVSHLSGSFTGVMGLPVFELMDLLRQCEAETPPFNQSHSN